ncbi:MAG: hypothetical protein QM640_10840 [Niabella sp.]
MFHPTKMAIAVLFKKMGAAEGILRTSNFFQPSFQYIRDHIISSDSELSYKLWKGLNLNMKLTYNKISRTGKENLIFTYGLGYEKYF